MSALEELNLFLKNVGDAGGSGYCEWLNEQKEAILQLKKENERQRAVRKLIIEYKALHRVKE